MAHVIDVLCRECGGELAVTVVHQNFNTLVVDVVVEPCEVCVQNAGNEGQEIGFRHAEQGEAEECD